MNLRSLINEFLPGSLPFLLVGVCFGLLLLYGPERARRLGRLFLTFLALFYIFASTRVGANLLLAPLYRHTAHVASAADAQGATAVVLLNPGANTYRARGQLLTGMGQEQALRVIEAARVYKVLGDPIVIVAGGFPEQTDRPSLGAIFTRSLIELGVPAHRIVVEPASRNTRQHAENLKPYLEKYNVRKFVMVTSPVHMRRSIVTFRRAGYDFVTSAASLDSDFPDGLDSPVTPSTENLERVMWGTHEYLGLLYYWRHGWL